MSQSNPEIVLHSLDNFRNKLREWESGSLEDNEIVPYLRGFSSLTDQAERVAASINMFAGYDVRSIAITARGRPSGVKATDVQKIYNVITAAIAGEYNAVAGTATQKKRKLLDDLNNSERKILELEFRVASETNPPAFQDIAECLNELSELLSAQAGFVGFATSIQKRVELATRREELTAEDLNQAISYIVMAKTRLSRQERPIQMEKGQGGSSGDLIARRGGRSLPRVKNERSDSVGSDIEDLRIQVALLRTQMDKVLFANVPPPITGDDLANGRATIEQLSGVAEQIIAGKKPTPEDNDAVASAETFAVLVKKALGKLAEGALRGAGEHLVNWVDWQALVYQILKVVDQIRRILGSGS